MRLIPRPILVAAASCGLLALASAPVAARTCPSGQFLQVSKGKCISKSAARDLGIVSRAGHAAAKPKSVKAEATSEKAGQSTVAKSAPEPEPEADRTGSDRSGERRTETAVASAGAAQSLGFAAAQPEAPSVRRNIAPFGALQFGGFR